MSLKSAIKLFAFFSVVVIIMAIYIHLSTWFLWHLTPDGDIKLAINYSQPTSRLFDDLVTSAIKEMPPVLINSRRLVYVKNNQSSTITIVPANPFLFRNRHQIIQELTNLGWSTRSFGLLIIAHQGNSIPPLQSTKQAVINAYHSFLSPLYPYRPIIIAQINANASPLLSQNIALIGVTTSHGREFKAIVAPNLSNFPRFSIVGPSPPPQDDYLSINLPGSVVQSVLQQSSQSWQEIIYQKFHFTQTKPPIINLMATQQVSSMTIDQDSAALAVIGHSQTLFSTINQWLQDEESYSRPQKHAFKLPDGTLGYELIKGKPQTILSEPDQTGCRSPVLDNFRFWLCQNDQGVSFGTNPTATQQELNRVSTNTHQISLGSAYLKKLDILPIKLLRSLTYYNSGEYTIITAQLK